MAKQIFLTGFVDGWMSEDLRWALTNSAEKQIDIFISSFGGSVNKGLEMANLIQGIQAAGKKDIHTHNLAHADSIATAIFLAPPKENRHIVENSTLFIHEPRALIFDEVTQDDADKLSAELEMQKNRLADFYVKNIEGLEKDEAFSLMAGEVNLNADKMLEHGIVSEVLPNFEIAAQRSLISNQNNKQMGLFDMFKNKQPSAVAIADGVSLLYDGELKEGIEVMALNATKDFKLEGDHIDAEGRTIKIDANNKVTEIVAKVVSTPATDNTIVDQVAEILVAFETKMDAKIEALKKTGSTVKVPKIDNSATPAVVEGNQGTASKGVQARMKEIQAAKREKQGLN